MKNNTMTNTNKLYGVTTAMVTLFNKLGEVDYDAIRIFSNFLIEKGVHCLYPLGTTGEMYRLSIEERKKISETVITHAAGRVPVYIHVGAMTQTEVIDLAVHSAEIGADGIGVVTPAYFPATRNEIIKFYNTVLKAVPGDFPVYLYNIPQLAINDITTEIAADLAERWPNIVGIKYSFSDFRRTAEYLRIREENFAVMHGADSLLTALLALGCDGTISGVSTAYPEPFVAVYEAVQRDDWKTARVHQKYADLYAHALQNGSNMAYFKEALCYRGVVKEYQMRAPQLVLPPAEAQALRSTLSLLDAQYKTAIENL